MWLLTVSRQAPAAARAAKQVRRGDPSRRRTVGPVEMCTFGEWEVRGDAGAETCFHFRRGTSVSSLMFVAT